jgi:hypothetical protein
MRLKWEMCSFQTRPAGKGPRHATVYVSIPLEYYNFRYALRVTRADSHFSVSTCRSGQGDTDYHGSNGQADTHSLHSSHLSVQEDPLLIRTHKQQTSQQVRSILPHRPGNPRQGATSRVTESPLDKFARDFQNFRAGTFHLPVIEPLAAAYNDSR